MIDCPECKGAGKMATSYREAPAQKPAEEKEEVCILDAVGGFFKAMWQFFLNWWGAFVVVAALLFLAWFVHFAWVETGKKEAIKAKQVYLIVQYDDANQVQRCFLSPNKDSDVTIVGKGAIVYMDNIDQPGTVPATVGVSNLSKCLRYQ